MNCNLYKVSSLKSFLKTSRRYQNKPSTYVSLCNALVPCVCWFEGALMYVLYCITMNNGKAD